MLKHTLAIALVLAGCGTTGYMVMPPVRGMACAEYDREIQRLIPIVAASNEQEKAESAGFFVASVASSMVIPFSGLATIPVEQARQKDRQQLRSDLWSYRVAWEARGCGAHTVVASLPPEGTTIQ